MSKRLSEQQYFLRVVSAYTKRIEKDIETLKTMIGQLETKVNRCPYCRDTETAQPQTPPNKEPLNWEI